MKMKNVLKKVLLALILIPCMFTIFTGCFEKPKKNNTPTAEEIAKTQSEYYGVLRTLVENQKFGDSSSTATEVYSSSHDMKTYDWTGTGITTDKIARAEAEIDRGSDKSVYEYYGLQSDGTGYKVREENNPTGKRNQTTVITSKMDITNKSGDVLNNYKYTRNLNTDAETKTKSVTNISYGTQNYKYNLETKAFQEFVVMVEENDTLDELVDYYTTYLKEIVNKEVGITLGNDVKATMTISSTDLVLSLNIYDYIMPANSTRSEKNVDITAKLTYSFDSDSLNSINNKVEIRSIYDNNCYSEFGDSLKDYKIEFDPETTKTIGIVSRFHTKFVINLNDIFNNRYLTQDFEGYITV